MGNGGSVGTKKTREMAKQASPRRGRPSAEQKKRESQEEEDKGRKKFLIILVRKEREERERARETIANTRNVSPLSNM